MAAGYSAPSFSWSARSKKTSSTMVTYDQLDCDEFEYVTRKQRGRLYIINNHTFDVEWLPARRFSKLDVNALMQALKYVGFKDPHTEISENLSCVEMRNTFAKAAEQSYQEHSCLFIIVLTHGDSDRLYGVDGVAMAYEYLLEPIRAASKGHGCLNGIPKILLVQACDASLAHIKHPPDEYIPRLVLPPPLEHDGFDASSPALDTAPNSDVIISYSTLPGTKYGSRFIQAFAQVMRRDGKRLDVAIMFARASRLVASLPGTTKLNKSLPSPNIISQLKKNVYFS